MIKGLIIDETFEYVKLCIPIILKKIQKELHQIIANRIIEYQVEESKHCSELASILYKEPVNLLDIYYAIPIKQTNRKFSLNSEKVANLFKSTNKIGLLGTAGSGKTTFIKYLFLKSTKESYKVPVLIYLRNIQVPMLDLRKGEDIHQNLLHEYVTDLFEFQKIGIDKAAVTNLLDSGSFLFILDGYDEVKDECAARIARDTEEFTKRFSKNCYIITSRFYSGLEYFSGFRNFTMEGISQDEIPEFIKKQLFKNPIKAKEIINVIEENNSNKILPYLSNPLFLILFINAFDSYPNLPKLKSKFYWQVFDALYEKHDNLSKTGFKRERPSKISRDSFELVLNALCFTSYFEQKFLFDENYLVYTVNKLRKQYKLEFESRDFLTELRNDLCLIIEDGLKLTFLHRSIQEYFASKFIENFDDTLKGKFLSKLSFLEVNHHKHSFLIELLSEMFPLEFIRYFIPSHVENVLEFHREIFLTNSQDASKITQFIYDFAELKKILLYNEEVGKIYARIISLNANNYTFHKGILEATLTSNSFHSGNEVKDENIRVESLILKRNKELFLDQVSSYIKRFFDQNNDMLNLMHENNNI